MRPNAIAKMDVMINWGWSLSAIVVKVGFLANGKLLGLLEIGRAGLADKYLGIPEMGGQMIGTVAELKS